MTTPIQHPDEANSNTLRTQMVQVEPRSLRTYTPTQAVLARSAGIYHWTPEDRRLYDFTSGVLVVNLGHNPESWMERFVGHMGWPYGKTFVTSGDYPVDGYFGALPMTAYN